MGRHPVVRVKGRFMCCLFVFVTTQYLSATTADVPAPTAKVRPHPSSRCPPISSGSSSAFVTLRHVLGYARV